MLFRFKLAITMRFRGLLKKLAVAGVAVGGGTIIYLKAKSGKVCLCISILYEPGHKKQVFGLSDQV